MADITWNGSLLDGNLFEPDNWDGGVIPTTGDNAIFPGGTPQPTQGGLTCDSAVFQGQNLGVESCTFSCPVTVDPAAEAVFTSVGFGSDLTILYGATVTIAGTGGSVTGTTTVTLGGTASFTIAATDFQFNGPVTVDGTEGGTYVDQGGGIFTYPVTITSEVNFSAPSAYNSDLTVNLRGSFGVLNGFPTIGGDLTVDGSATSSPDQNVVDGMVTNGMTVTLTKVSAGHVTASAGGASMFITGCIVTNTLTCQSITFTNCEVRYAPVATGIFCNGTVLFLNPVATTFDFGGAAISVATGTVTFLSPYMGASGFGNIGSVTWSSFYSVGVFGVVTGHANVLENPNYPTSDSVLQGTSYGHPTVAGNVLLPAVGNVRNGTSYGVGGNGSAGTLTLPAAAQVLSGIQFGSGGTQYTGTVVQASVADVRTGSTFGPGGGLTGILALPNVNEVLTGIGFGTSGTQFTGTVTQPDVGDVRLGVEFGAGGNQYTGTLVADGTYPTEGQVLGGIAYGPTGTEYEGTLALPTQSNVRNGLGYGADGTQYTGILVLPAAADVVFGVGFGAAGSQYTGTVVLPAVGNVRFGTAFGPSSGSTGTLALPTAAQVLTAVGFGAGGNEFTGTITLPDVEDVRDGTEYGAGGDQYEGTLVAVDPPPAANQTVAYTVTRNGQGVAQSGIILQFSYDESAAETPEDSLTREIFTVTSGVDGQLTVALPKNSKFRARRGSGAWVPFTTGSGPTYALPQILDMQPNP